METQPAAHAAPTATTPGRDRNGQLIDMSLVLTDEQEDALIEGLSEKAADIAWWFLQHFWNWSRQDQVTLRAFATAAAKVSELQQQPLREVKRELEEARQVMSVLSQQLELDPADIVAAMQVEYP
jgi:hypothetical protein